MRVPNPIYLGIAVVIFAASNSVTRKIIDIGENHLIDGRNPISPCNVLFVGNLCALVLMTLIFYQDWKPRILKAISRKDWLILTVTGILSGAIVPALIFMALEKTNVTNIVLIGRIEPILTLILSFFILGSRVSFWTIVGSVVSLIGVGVTAFLGSSEQMINMGGFHLGVGELYVAIASIITALSTVLGKLQLQSISLGIFTIYRNILATVTFLILANVLYGPQHFIDVFSPILWKWMFIYAAIIVVFGQICWLAGLRSATATELNLASLLNPIIAILMAYLILGEVPTSAQYIGGSLLLIGFILSLMGNWSKPKIDQKVIDSHPSQAMDTPMGFRGI